MFLAKLSLPLLLAFLALPCRADTVTFGAPDRSPSLASPAAPPPSSLPKCPPFLDFDPSLSRSAISAVGATHPAGDLAYPLTTFSPSLLSIQSDSDSDLFCLESDPKPQEIVADVAPPEPSPATLPAEMFLIPTGAVASILLGTRLFRPTF